MAVADLVNDNAEALGEANDFADAAHERRIFVFNNWQAYEDHREVEHEDRLNQLRLQGFGFQRGGVAQDADVMDVVGVQNGATPRQRITPYAQLTPLHIAQEELSDVECGILYASFKEIEEAVAVKTGNVVHIFEYAALMRYWQSYGTNPCTTRILQQRDILRVVVQGE